MILRNNVEYERIMMMMMILILEWEIDCCMIERRRCLWISEFCKHI